MKNRQKYINQLLQKIEIMREQLELMLENYEINEGVLEKSRELDLLITSYIEITKK